MKVSEFVEGLRKDGFKVVALTKTVEIHCGFCTSAWVADKKAIRKPSFHHLHLLNHLYSHKDRVGS